MYLRCLFFYVFRHCEGDHESAFCPFLERFKGFYAPMTAGGHRPFARNAQPPPGKIARPDRLFPVITKALAYLTEAAGLKGVKANA